ncbi:MAG: hypothetical protein ACKO3F_01990 [Cyanobium sp.]
MRGLGIGILIGPFTGSVIARQISFRVALGTLVDGTAACRIQFQPFCF